MHRRQLLAATLAMQGATLQAGAQPLAAPQPIASGPWPEAPGRPAIIAPRPLRFPVDFGSHPAHRTEWWYLTGWLDVAGTSTRTFGFQITFFRSRTGFAATDSRFAPQQLIIAHVALSDLQQGRARQDQRIARAGFGARASESDTDVGLHDWTLRRSGPPDQSAYRIQVSSDTARFAFDFSLASTQPTLLQGEDGYSRKGNTIGQASHYYSHPQLALQGTLVLDGRSVPVTGKGWMDHEWSDAMLGSDAVGWDWIGMNLDDGSALMAFQIRRRDGTPSFAGGSFRPAAGAVRDFGPGEVRFTPGRRWKSPTSGATYPVEWTVETPAGTFHIASLLDAQEQDNRTSTGAWYWEGLSELRTSLGTSSSTSRRVGRGYLEMTGYVQSLVL